MRTIKLDLIQKPKGGTRVVFITPKVKNTTIFTGVGDTNLICGGCGSILAKSLEVGQLRNVVLHCNNCGGYNDVQ